MDRAQRNLDRTTLKAPFAGRVNQVQLDVGDYASRNQQALELISDQLDFYAQVRGPLARALTLGQRVTVRVADRSYTATLAAVQPDPDPRSLSDLGVRSEASGRVSTNRHDFEAHSGPTQRGIGAIWAAVPQGELRSKRGCPGAPPQ
jgi:multidrug efflux pump subunit AcrA (membrane-fusion protein)